MITKDKRIAVVIAIAVLLIFGLYQLKINNERHNKINQEKYAIQEKEAKERYLAGPYVTNETKISDHEITKTIIYPGKDGDMYDSIFDSTCLVYINTTTNNQSMKCSGNIFDGP